MCTDQLDRGNKATFRLSNLNAKRYDQATHQSTLDKTVHVKLCDPWCSARGMKFGSKLEQVRLFVKANQAVTFRQMLRKKMQSALCLGLGLQP